MLKTEVGVNPDLIFGRLQTDKGQIQVAGKIPLTWAAELRPEIS